MEVVLRLMSSHGTAAEPGVECLPPHADRVDLVDEDDALAAPLPRQLLCAAGEDAHDDCVDADERRREARSGDRDERRVEAGRESLREHRLSGPGRAEEQQSALTLASCALERLTRLPDRDDASHLFLRLDLPADVRELDAPLGVAGLERLDLRQVHEQQRAEEDDEVEDQEERQHDEQRQHLDEQRGVEEEVGEEADDPAPDPGLHPEAPEPDPPPRDDVLLAQLSALEPEQARAGDQAVKDEVDDAAEGGDHEERGEDRPVPRPALRLVEPDDHRRSGEECDQGRCPCEPPPLTGELGRELALLEARQVGRFGRHPRSSDSFRVWMFVFCVGSGTCPRRLSRPAKATSRWSSIPTTRRRR